MRVCARVRVDECVIVIESVRVKCACVVKSCVRLGVPACVEVRVHARVRVCMRVCVNVCERERECACVCARTCACGVVCGGWACGRDVWCVVCVCNVVVRWYRWWLCAWW